MIDKLATQGLQPRASRAFCDSASEVDGCMFSSPYNVHVLSKGKNDLLFVCISYQRIHGTDQFVKQQSLGVDDKALYKALKTFRAHAIFSDYRFLKSKSNHSVGTRKNRRCDILVYTQIELFGCTRRHDILWTEESCLYICACVCCVCVLCVCVCVCVCVAALGCVQTEDYSESKADEFTKSVLGK